MKFKVLYVEDELFLGRIVSETLTREGFEVILVDDGAKVLDQLRRFNPDLCLLDIMLPNVDGYTLCRQIRSSFPGLPVLFLTAKAETEDLVKGFEAGGTDYLKKPFSMDELIVRMHNQLQLSGNRKKKEELLEEQKIGMYTFVPQRYELHSPSQVIRLSQREMEVLALLVKSVNQPIERNQILNMVWKDDSFFNSRTLDVYIRKIRTYFGEDPSIEIVTLKGKGYLFLVR